MRGAPEPAASAASEVDPAFASAVDASPPEMDPDLRAGCFEAAMSLLLMPALYARQTPPQSPAVNQSLLK
jgi:hypothetical protein